MFFSLEALAAKHGDSLLLHYGEASSPKLIVIDGGPPGVFSKALWPRLEQLREAAGGELAIEILMVSHIDDDHVRGVLDFARKLGDEPALQSSYRVRTLWLNSFDDLVPVPAAAGAELQTVVATVGEGRGLRDAAAGLHWKQNAGFDKFVVAPDDAGVPIEMAPLKLTVVGPRQAELDELRKTWEKEVAKLKTEPSRAAAVADYLDKSVYNLSSIVCLAELGGKRMLLTGDARGDKILLGLEAAGFLAPGGQMELDLLKMPHHGSSHDVEQSFFERLRAREMVISADGEYDNPDLETLQMISAARPDDEFTLHLTYSDFLKEVGPKIHGFFAEEKAAGRRYGVSFREADALSLRVDLLEAPPG
jgi:hypothetical protein